MIIDYHSIIYKNKVRWILNEGWKSVFRLIYIIKNPSEYTQIYIMIPGKNYTGHVSIYPGEYELVTGKVEELRKKLKIAGTRIIWPAYNICETVDHYRIDLAVPGFNRQDLFIHGSNHLLSVTGLKKRAYPKEAVTPNELTYECMKREIILPNNVDMDFASAEYKNGILSISLYKTKYPINNRPVDIIAY